MSSPEIGYKDGITDGSTSARTSNKTCSITTTSPFNQTKTTTLSFAIILSSILIFVSLNLTLIAFKYIKYDNARESSHFRTFPSSNPKFPFDSAFMLIHFPAFIVSLALFYLQRLLFSSCCWSSFHSSSPKLSKSIPLSSLLVVFILCCANDVKASEFPERECCDPIYPIVTSTAATPPSAITVPAGKPGLNVRTSIAILNCLLARQLCFEDASCSAILEIIPRVCGSELVACSTITVTKCQAALRTLQAFPFFKPTCLCKEPNVDPECNSFRDFLFDHPCVFVLKKEKDPYPVEALPTCNYALNVCHSEKSCAALFDTFKTACRARDGDCRMDDKDQCREAWAGLRMSPLFGCICPNNHMKKRCDRIFAMVNHNPCVEVKKGRNDMDLFLTRLQRLRHNPKRPTLAPPTDRHPDRFNLHPSKLPDSYKKIPQHSLKHHRGISLEYKTNITGYVASDGSILRVTENGTQVITDDGKGNLIGVIFTALERRLRGHATASASRRHPNVSRNRINSVNAVSQDGKKIPPSIGNENNKTTFIDSNHNKDNVENNWVSGVDLGPEEGFELDDHHISPHIMEEGHRRMFGRPGRRKGGTHHWKQNEGPKRIGSNDDGHDGSPRMSLKSTCQLALDRCIRDKSCTAALTPILQNCDTSRCDRDGCMESLRNFYRTPSVLWNLEIAFCLCKKTDNKEDACMNAQEKLHPVCAQREPNGQLPFCHVLAQTCRETPDCRMRLEMYEQSCAVDSVTKRCAGNTESCRTAVLNMLGTDLRTACACKGTDYNHLYDCLGWQRLLWLNPCVVESQSDFHIKTYGATSTPAFDNGIRTIHEIYSETANKPTTAVMVPHTTRQPAVILVTIPPRTIINTHEESKIGRNIEVEIVQGGNKEQEAIIVVEPPTTIRTTTTTEEQTTTPTTTQSTTTTTEMETTTRTTTTSTTPEPIKYCTVQRPELDDQFVQKGHTKRLYRDAELDCSELCHCDNHLSVSCHAVCVRHAPCRTALAYYSHAAPAYQAYRGRCYCYSGSFICMRPNPGEYSLPPGVYLLLGFSSQDEALLRPHTRLGLEDAVRVLQEYMLTLPDEGTNCTLTLFNVTNENMIITASVPSNQVGNPITLLDNDKMECIELLETLKSKINSQDYDISSHLLLSIFKIAEVDIIYPPPSSATVKGPSILLMLSAFFVLAFLHGKYGLILSHLIMHIVGDLVMNIYIKLVGFMIECNIHTYRVMSIALEMVAHNIFYFSRYLVASATLVFFHFFSRHYFNYEKNTIINREFEKIAGQINDFIFELKVMPSARLFYEKMCFLYTFIGTKVPSTRLDLSDHDIVITIKHIITAVKNNFMKCIYRCCYYKNIILSVKCIFCRSVHLESMFYSLRNTIIDIMSSLLTKLYDKCFIVVCLLMFVVNFAMTNAASDFTDKFSARIKTDIFLLILYGGFLINGVQRGGVIIEIINNNYYKNIKFDCLQCIFLKNVLCIGYFMPFCCRAASILFLTAVTRVKMAVDYVTKHTFHDFVSFFTFAGTLSVMFVSLFTPEYFGSQIITDKYDSKKNFADSSNFTESTPVILLKSIFR